MSISTNYFHNLSKLVPKSPLNRCCIVVDILIFIKFVLLLIYILKMKKLLLSVAALMFATLLFSLGDSSDDNKEMSQDNPIVVVNDIDLAP